MKSVKQYFNISTYIKVNNLGQHFVFFFLPALGGRLHSPAGSIQPRPVGCCSVYCWWTEVWFYVFVYVKQMGSGNAEIREGKPVISRFESPYCYQISGWKNIYFHNIFPLHICPTVGPWARPLTHLAASPDALDGSPLLHMWPVVAWWSVYQEGQLVWKWLPKGFCSLWHLL